MPVPITGVGKWQDVAHKLVTVASWTSKQKILNGLIEEGSVPEGMIIKKMRGQILVEGRWPETGIGIRVEFYGPSQPFIVATLIQGSRAWRESDMVIRHPDIEKCLEAIFTKTPIPPSEIKWSYSAATDK